MRNRKEKDGRADSPRRNLRNEDLRTIGAAQGIGCSVVVSLIVFIGLGIFLDQYFGTAPIWILVGVGLGLIASGYQLYELTLIGRKDTQAGPLGRSIGRGLAMRRARKNKK